MYKIVEGGFLDDGGQFSRFLRVAGSNPPQTWAAKQEESRHEYLERVKSTPEDVRIAYRLFDAYLAAVAYVHRPARVLDVGCGINPCRPPYVSTLCTPIENQSLIYVGLDPIEQNLNCRDYPFVCARLEDTAELFVDGFDFFVFATSLDHLEDLRSAAQAVRRLAGENAACVFWVGVHDSARVAEAAGAAWFKELFASAQPTRLLRALAACAKRLPVLCLELLRREYRLSNSVPLDQLHFQYFTSESLTPALELFGEVLDLMPVAGTSSVFAVVKVAAERQRAAS